MYSLKEFSKLEQKYGMYSSWAIWDEKNPSDTSIIQTNHNELNSKYVFLALNISAPLHKPWCNFHGGKHDRKLMKVCNKTTLRGSYITDIFKGIINVNSSALKNLAKKTIEENVSFFNNEMEDIKVDKDTVFIILGTESSLISKYFKEHFQSKYKNKTINYYHYSYYGIGDDEWVKGLLRKINAI